MLETEESVIIKIYERAKMKAKHVQRLEREIVLMCHLAGRCAGGCLVCSCMPVLR